jgi:hypothetical protein
MTGIEQGQVCYEKNHAAYEYVEQHILTGILVDGPQFTVHSQTTPNMGVWHAPTPADMCAVSFCLMPVKRRSFVSLRITY